MTARRRRSPAKPAAAKWHAKPARVGRAWGVCLNVAAHLGEPAKGDTVRVVARSGKKWLAVLDECKGQTRWGTTWTTVRA